MKCLIGIVLPPGPMVYNLDTLTSRFIEYLMYEKLGVIDAMTAVLNGGRWKLPHVSLQWERVRGVLKKLLKSLSERIQADGLVLNPGVTVVSDFFLGTLLRFTTHGTEPAKGPGTHKYRDLYDDARVSLEGVRWWVQTKIRDYLVSLKEYNLTIGGERVVVPGIVLPDRHNKTVMTFVDRIVKG
jgi:hypothetical protein